MRSLSPELLEEMFAGQSGVAIAALVSIEHPTLGLLRYTNVHQVVISEGHSYDPVPFTMTLPSSEDDRPPVARLVVAHVSPDVTEAILEAATEQPEVVIRLVRMENTSQVEIGPVRLTARRAVAGAESVEIELGIDDPLTEPYPADTFTPGDTPAIF